MREFKTAVEEKVESEDFIEFKIDDQVIKAFPPGEGQMAFLMSRIGRHSNGNEKLAGIIDFFVGVLDDESSEYITERLMDRKDPFGFTDVTEIIEFLTEEWSGRPTKRSTASTK